MQPTTGDRVRITRTRPDGTVRFAKAGTVLRSDSHHGFTFREDESTGSRFVASSAAVARDMPGWTQTITKEV